MMNLDKLPDKEITINVGELMMATEQAFIMKYIKNGELPSLRVLNSAVYAAVDIFKIMAGDLKVPEEAKKIQFRAAQSRMREILNDWMEVLDDDSL